jgi:hypothetical protein
LKNSDELDARIDDLETRIEKRRDQMDQAARDKARAALNSLREKSKKRPILGHGDRERKACLERIDGVLHILN